MAALGPITNPRKPDHACSWSWSPARSLYILPEGIPFHERVPVSLCSEHHNSNKEELMSGASGHQPLLCLVL